MDINSLSSVFSSANIENNFDVTTALKGSARVAVYVVLSTAFIG